MKKHCLMIAVLLLGATTVRTAAAVDNFVWRGSGKGGVTVTDPNDLRTQWFNRQNWTSNLNTSPRGPDSVVEVDTSSPGAIYLDNVVDQYISLSVYGHSPATTLFVRGNTDLTLSRYGIGTESRPHGQVRHESGRIKVGQNFSLGGDVRSTYHLSGGELSITGFVTIGSQSDSLARFIQTGGTWSSSRQINLADGFDSEAVVELSGGSIVASTLITRLGDANFAQTGGNALFSNTFFAGVVTENAPDSINTFTLGGGVFRVGNLRSGGLSGITRFQLLENQARFDINDRWQLMDNAELTVSPGFTARLHGADFEHRGVTPTRHADLANLRLLFMDNESEPSLLEVSGHDVGQVPAGFDDNFALGTLVIGRDDSAGWVRLTDSFDNQTTTAGNEAIYVDQLIVGPDSTLDLNGLNIYARAALIDPGATIQPGGGSLSIQSELAVIAGTRFDEPSIGAASYSPSLAADELGFQTTQRSSGGNSPQVGVVNSSGTPTSPVFRHKSIEATTIFDSIDLDQWNDVSVSLHVQVDDASYEAEDFLRIFVTDGLDEIDLLSQQGSVGGLGPLAGEGYSDYFASIPEDWSTATLVISSFSNSGSGSEAYDFDSIEFRGVLIPEPTTLTLALLALIGCATRRMRRRR